MDKGDRSFSGFKAGWAAAVMGSIAAFWIFLLTGDIMGLGAQASHALVRQASFGRSVGGAIVGFALATVAGLILGLCFGVATSITLNSPSKESMLVPLLTGTFVFSNVFAITVCT